MTSFKSEKLIVSRNVTDDIFNHCFSVDEMMEKVVRKLNMDRLNGYLVT